MDILTTGEQAGAKYFAILATYASSTEAEISTVTDRASVGLTIFAKLIVPAEDKKGDRSMV